MKCEHFLRYMQNGVGYRLLKSQGLDDFLQQESLRYLVQLEPPGPVQTYLHQEKHVAISYLGYTEDEYQRRSVWNHTILVFIGDYFKLNTVPPQIVEKMIHETDKNLNIIDSGDALKKLQPIVIEA